MGPWIIFISFGVAETIAIRCLSDPKPDWFQSAGAALAANGLAWLVMTLTRPLITQHWDVSIAGSWGNAGMPQILEATLAWFCAFTLSNATELATLKWGGKIGLTKSLGLVISAANAYTAFHDIAELVKTGAQ